ncbi:MAG TPA: hypothetical protein PKM32_01110, partial [Planctomycetota bacterium]|nr:hypothetical protein [Planctomycetota bacterium]
MILRPEKTEIISSIIPKELDIILIGDLVFRKNLHSFVVKGLDVIDANVKKFGELKMECRAACAITTKERNLPDYRIDGRNLYQPFLTRDRVLSLCENVYPIENPEKAIAVWDEWKKYINFRQYWLDVQSQRNEAIENINFLYAYSIKQSEYRKNKELYSPYLLDNRENFAHREDVLLAPPTKDTENTDNSTEDDPECLKNLAKFPLIKIKITKNLAEINQTMEKGNKSKYESELRRFSKTEVALSDRQPEIDNNNNKLIYLGGRVAFTHEDIFPNHDDIHTFFDLEISQKETQIDEKYKERIEALVEVYRQEQEKELDKSMQQNIQNFSENLDKNLESDIKNNSDKSIEKRYTEAVQKIKTTYKEKESEECKRYEKEVQKIKTQCEQEIKKLNDQDKKYIEKIEKIKTQCEQEIKKLPIQEEIEKIKTQYEQEIKKLDKNGKKYDKKVKNINKKCTSEIKKLEEQYKRKEVG